MQHRAISIIITNSCKNFCDAKEQIRASQKFISSKISTFIRELKFHFDSQ